MIGLRANKLGARVVGLPDILATRRRRSMRFIKLLSAVIILSVVLSAVQLISWNPSGQVLSASALVNVTDNRANLVIEVGDEGAFDEIVAFATAHGIRMPFSSPETGILTLNGKGIGPEFVDALSRLPGVLSISSEKRARTMFTPNDTNVGLQWGLSTVKAYQAWDITRGTQSVVVAVLDTGIDWRHPDLASNMWNDSLGYHGYNFVSSNRDTMDDNTNSYNDAGEWIPDTYTYHGTHVAGVIGAVANNGLGVAGMAQVKLMAVKVMNDSGEGTDTFVASGIRWAVDNGANVITMSLGVDGMSTSLASAVNYASNHGVVMAAASGNSGSSIVSYPAAYPKVIAVGAIDSTSRKASFSNYGDNLDVMAPGVQIYSTQVGGGYQYLSGTSTAAPFVAGVAALMLSINPSLAPVQIGSIINSTAQDIRTTGYDTASGWGIVDAFMAVEQVANPTVTITKHPDYATPNSTFSITWMVSGGDPGIIQGSTLRWGASPASLSQSSAVFTGQTWTTFTVDDVPSLTELGTIYLKAYATVDGTVYESGLLELPVQNPPPDGLFAQFIKDVQTFIFDDLGLFNFLLLLAVLIAIPAIVIAARPKRRRVVYAAPHPQLSQYQPIHVAQTLPPPPPPPPRFEAYVDLVGRDVMPQTIKIYEGTKVVWVNRSWAPPPGIAIRSGRLDQTGEHPDGTFESGLLIAPGDYWSVTFHRAGEYSYYLTGIWKTAKIVVEPYRPGDAAYSYGAS